MLIQFSVKNFKSFKDKIVFSMEAGKENEHKENIIDELGEKILKTSAVYGANASGKTNLINAFTASILMIRKSNTRQIGERLGEMIPFAFDEETKNKPCEFEFIFTTKGSKYIYGFSADKEKVYDEYLYQYLTAKPTRIFERTNTNQYKFLQSDESKLNTLKTQNTENKLFLSTATTWNYEKTQNPFLWFAKDIDTYVGGLTLTEQAIDAYNNDQKEDLKKFTLKLLKEADIDIKDFNIEIKESEVDPNIMIMFNGQRPGPISQKRQDVRIKIIHEIKDDDDKIKKYELNYLNESLGTQILFSFAPVLKDVFENGKTIIIDELERSLHHSLVKMIIKFFDNPEINKGNAQLIFNTHDTSLLSLKMFRRDQIWFTEKNSEKGTTEIYPLDDFSVRKTENIQKGYLNGRYGAIPFVDTGDTMWED